MLLFTLWALIQTASWTPEAWHHPIWDRTRDFALGPRGSISIDPDAMRESLIRIGTYVGCFLLAFFACLDPLRAKRFLTLLCLVFSAYALYGLMAQMAGSETILWYEKWAYKGFLTSTFVNKNSYATYAGLGFLCALGRLWIQLKHTESKDRALAEKSRFIAWLKHASLRDILFAFMPVMILGSLILSGSRGGLVSLLAGLFAFLVFLAANRRWSWYVWIGLAGLLFVFVASALFVGGEGLALRSGDAQIEVDAATRLRAYALIKSAIGQNFWLGLGLGTFENGFRLYRDSSFALWFQHAHNDYLELMLETGVPAALAYLGAIFLAFAVCLKGIWLRKRNEIFPVIASSAAVLVGVHGLMDFSLQIPAIAATFAALLGMGAAQSFSQKN
jgi:O-antigen ligase